MSAKTTILHENGTDDELYPVTKASVTYRNDGTTTVEGTLTDYDTLEEKFGDTSAILPTTAQTVIGAIAEHETDLNNKQPRISYVAPFENISYTTQAANAWEKIGVSFTVPSNHRYIIQLASSYNAGKPIGLGLSTSSTANRPNYMIQADEVQRYTLSIGAGTYYVWAMRGGTGTNRYDAGGLDIQLD